MLHRNRALALALALAGVAAGCAPLTSRFYRGLDEPYPPAGALALRGKVIVIDPGHGADDTGAVGPTGLTEKEVNLGVALRLERLLSEAGAHVIMTRTTDRSLAPHGAPAWEELQDRIALANEAHADLFMSIHHNASARKDADKLETQIYYRMDDPGPSRDVAALIARHFAIDLDLPHTVLYPGNYYLLRHADVPAVLGEASYMTDPATEALLRDPAKQELEAEAYFLALSDYFSRGVPHIERVVARPSARTCWARIADDGGAIARQSMKFDLDGQSLSAVYEPDLHEVEATLPGDLSNGPHELSLQVRNLLGNASPLATTDFAVARPPVRLTPTLSPGIQVHGRDTDPMPAAVEVVDAFGRPVADGQAVYWRTEGRPRARWRLSRTTTVGGVARNWLLAGKGITFRTPLRVAALAGKRVVRWQVRPAAIPYQAGVVLDAAGHPLAGAMVTMRGATGPFLTEVGGRGDRSGVRIARSAADGTFYVANAPYSSYLRVMADGYRTIAFNHVGTAYLSLPMDPLPGMGLRGQVILLDPEGGGTDQRGRSPSGVAASEANFDVAEDLVPYLEHAGAKVYLTRPRETGIQDPDRVRLSNHVGATLFVTIAHGADAVPVGSHYPTSATGARYARMLAETAADELGLPAWQVIDDSTYPLIQTACPAVRIELPWAPLSSADLARHAVHEAYALYLGMQDPPPGSASISVEVRYRSGAPATDALTTLDVLWPGMTDATGSWRFDHLASGEHYVEVDDGHWIQSMWVPGLADGEHRTVTLVLDQPDLPESLGHEPSPNRIAMLGAHDDHP